MKQATAVVGREKRGQREICEWLHRTCWAGLNSPFLEKKISPRLGLRRTVPAGMAAIVFEGSGVKGTLCAAGVARGSVAPDVAAADVLVRARVDLAGRSCASSCTVFSVSIEARASRARLRVVLATVAGAIPGLRTVRIPPRRVVIGATALAFSIAEKRALSSSTMTLLMSPAKWITKDLIGMLRT